MSRARIRKVIDFGRLREAMAGSGADPRSWVVLARVDDDDDAVRWDTNAGWIVDVTFTFGDLAGEGPIACRVSSALGGDGGGHFSPPRANAECLVQLPGGDPNASPILVGYTCNEEANKPPETVNGETINEEFAKANEIVVTSASVEVQAGTKVRVACDDEMKLLSQVVKIADDDAGQSFVRGDDQKSTLNTFLDALQTWAGLVKVGVTAGGGTLDNTAFDLAIAQAKQGLANALSSRIKGE